MNALAAAYAALTGLWLALRHLTADRPWWLQAINEFTPFVLVPALPLLLLSVLRRSPLGALAALIPGSVLVLLYQQRFAPKACPEGPRPSLRLMTLNILCRPRPLDSLLRAIRESAPDIVMLQEVLPAMGGPLGSELLDEYPYQAIYPATRARGTAIFSRLPFEKDERFQFSSRGWYCQEVGVTWNERRLALFNLHLMSPRVKLKWGRAPFDSSPRAAEMRQLIDRVQIQDHDVVIAGDFNMTDQSDDYRAIRGYMNDAFLDAGSGFGFTYPAKSPHGKFWYERYGPALLRLDHVFYQGRLRARSAWVGPNGDSDHYSLIVELETLVDERSDSDLHGVGAAAQRLP